MIMFIKNQNTHTHTHIYMRVRARARAYELGREVKIFLDKSKAIFRTPTKVINKWEKGRRGWGMGDGLVSSLRKLQ